MDGDTVTYALSGSGYFEIDEMRRPDNDQHVAGLRGDGQPYGHGDWRTTPRGMDSIDVTIMVGNVVECEDAGAVAVDDRTNTGLMADCEALLASKDTLMGDGATMTLNWAVDMPIGQWDGIRGAAVPWRHAGAGNLVVPPWHKRERGSWQSRSQAERDDTGRAGPAGRIDTAVPASQQSDGGYRRIEWLDQPGLAAPLRQPVERRHTDLSGMTSLERLYIHQNQFTGGVPTGLSDSVTHILVQRNDLRR